MSRTTILIILGIVAIVGGIIGYRYVSNSSGASYELAEVQKGELVQEISASGKVEPPTKVDLHFKNSGKLTVLSAKVGKKVVAGQLLAKQDTSVLDAQLAEMQAGIDVQKAKLDQLYAVAENDRQNLVDKLQDAYTKADDVVRNKTDQFFSNPQSDNPQISFFVIDSQLETDVEWGRLLMEYQLKKWKTSIDQLTITSDLAAYLDEAQKNLGEVKSFLDKVALAVNNPNNKPNSVSQTTYDGWRTDVSIARTNVNTSITNLSAAEKDLLKEEDVALYEAQIRQAEAQMQKIQAQRQEMIIAAPSAGIVTQTNGEVGEIATPDMVIVSLMPSGSLQIKVDISEADVVNVSVGQGTRITLDAFDADTEWKGKVASIDPAETIVGGAVYYQTTVLFDKEDGRIRSGMTANVWIKAAHKENSLVVPAKAVKEKEGKEFVEVLDGSRVQEKEVQTGMKGEGGMVEILSGLNEGEEIIVGVKKQQYVGND